MPVLSNRGLLSVRLHEEREVGQVGDELFQASPCQLAASGRSGQHGELVPRPQRGARQRRSEGARSLRGDGPGAELKSAFS